MFRGLRNVEACFAIPFSRKSCFSFFCAFLPLTALGRFCRLRHVTLTPVFDITLKSPKSRRHQGFYFVKRLAIGDLYPPVRYRGFRHAGAASPRPPSALAALAAFALHAARGRAGRADRIAYTWYVTCKSMPEKESSICSSAGR